MSTRGALSIALPGTPPPSVRVALREVAEQRLETNLDTLIIEPDEMRVLLLWRAHLTLPKAAHDVREIEVTAALPAR